MKPHVSAYNGHRQAETCSYTHNGDDTP